MRNSRNILLIFLLAFSIYACGPKGRDGVEEENYETVKDWLDTGKFGYGEDQVSPGKFAQRAKKSQAALSEFIAENKDRLEG